MDEIRTYSAFSGTRLVAAGEARVVVQQLKELSDRGAIEQALVFEDETGKQVDFNLQGTMQEALERVAPAPRVGPGRPKLGVVSREVSLFPRHWEWLERQPGGISGAIRRLVDEARQRAPGAEKARLVREAVSNFMTAMAGDLPDYEEATRALFARDLPQFEALVAGWPQDIRGHVLRGAREAAQHEAESAR